MSAYIYDARPHADRQARRRAVRGTRPDDLAALVVRAIAERNPELDPAQIDDVYFGDANGAGEDNRDVARMAVLLAGFPTTRPRRRR